MEASPKDNQCNLWLPHKNVLPQPVYLAVFSGICRTALGLLGHSHDACFDPSSDVLATSGETAAATAGSMLCIVQIVIMLSSIAVVERMLNKVFDKQGNLKK